MESKDLQKYLHSNPLVRYTPNTITDPDLYEKKLEAVRKNGFAADDEEYISGVRAIAAPIKQHGAYIPAIWVVGFKASMATGKIPAIIKQTRAAAVKISNSI
jgi:DNA-binding IclR family transcriptional regulator